MAETNSKAAQGVLPSKPFRLAAAASATLAAMMQTALAVEPIIDGPAACMPAVLNELPKPAAEALGRISDLSRQLLASSMYLRSRNIEGRWSWSEEQIRLYEGSPPHAAALEAIERVRKHFEAENPGYTIRVNTNIRSLDTQLASWNANGSVGEAAKLLADEAKDRCKPASARRFVDWLRSWKPATVPNVAPPGLSPHGQGQAFDFQVMQRGTIIAPADSGRIQADWIDAGWGKRLADAMKEAGAGFSGPLTSPDEPWHYAYDAKAVIRPAAMTRAEAAPGAQGGKISPMIVPRPNPRRVALPPRR